MAVKVGGIELEFVPNPEAEDVETLVVKSERADMTAQEKRDLQALIALATRRLHGEF